jgi:hypothetical protein
MKPTRWVPLVAIAAIAMAVGWVLVDLVERVAGRILGVPWLAAVALWVLALGVLGWTVLVAARTAALALAASRTGVLIGGFYLGIALGLIGVRDTPTGASSMAAAVASVLACAVLVGAALWLESLCRLRDGDDKP